MSRSSRALTALERANLVGAALADLARARIRLQASGELSHVIDAKLQHVTARLQELYTGMTGRERHEVRCVHGIMLARTCNACVLHGEVNPTT